MQTDAKPRFTFESVARHHLPMLDSWIRQPHWRDWWGDADTEIGYIRDMVDGRDTTRPFIFYADGVPCGYIQYWFAVDQKDAPTLAEHPWLAELPDDAVGVDLSIADVQRLGRGLGPAVLREFAERLAGKGHETIVIDPDARNRRAVRAYEKAGFRPVPHLQGRTGATLIMQYQSERDLSTNE